MQKMTRQQFVELFPPFVPDDVDPNVTSEATRPNHKHIHKPAARSKPGKMTPAQYRHKHKGVKK